MSLVTIISPKEPVPAIVIEPLVVVFVVTICSIVLDEPDFAKNILPS